MQLFRILVLLLCFSKSFGQGRDGYHFLQKAVAYHHYNLKDTNLFSFAPNMKNDFSINYIEPLGKIVANKKELLGANNSSNYFQPLGTYLSFIGDYKRAISVYDSCEYDPKVNYRDSLTPSLLSEINGMEFINAQEVIIDSAVNHKIVMINEAHHHGRHRVFTFSLLKGLYSAGYRYFGLETLSPDAFNPDQVVSTKSGYYSFEPCMAELVRWAKELGFTVFAYEASHDSPINRDTLQAYNIISKIEHFSKGKVLIHAGYGHISERFIGVPTIGLILKDSLKEDPLTVDQVDFSEGYRNSKYQGLYYSLASSNTNISEPAVMFKAQRPFGLFDGLYDLTVYTPPAVYLNGRPTWLATQGIRQLAKFKIPRGLAKKAFLLQAYFQNEADVLDVNQLIPHDQTYFFDKNSANLYLRQGKFLLIYRDLENQVLRKQKVSVEY